MDFNDYLDSSDELSRIESIYGSVAEYNRVLYEEDLTHFERSEEEIAQADNELAIYNAKIKYLDGTPSEFVIKLRREWEKLMPQEKDFKTSSEFIYAGYDYSKDKVINCTDAISKYYDVECSENAASFYNPGVNKFGIKVDYIDCGEYKYKFIGGLDYEMFKNVFRDLHYLDLYPTMSLEYEPGKTDFLSNCSLGNLRISDLKRFGFETNDSISKELESLGFDETKIIGKSIDENTVRKIR